MKIIKAAANLIKSEKRYIRYKANVYSSKADSELSRVFVSYSKIVNDIFSGTRFKTSISAPIQCILKAMKSNNVIPPLFFGLSAKIDHTIEGY